MIKKAMSNVVLLVSMISVQFSGSALPTNTPVLRNSPSSFGASTKSQPVQVC